MGILYITRIIKNPIDTERKLNVHKTFRRRPGHLLNVLCTFNLRPVSTGKHGQGIRKVMKTLEN